MLSLLCLLGHPTKRPWWLIFGIALKRTGGGGGVVWFTVLVCFSRLFNDWEMEMVQSFLQAIQRKRVLPRQEDILLLQDAKDGCYSVKLLYRAMDCSIADFFPHRLIWNVWVPFMVDFFA